MTLDATTQDLINDVVTEFIEQGRMFTAFEVSLAVKDRGAPYRHRNMRDYVHEVVFRVGGDRGTYTRTLMDVGAPEQAWVYHPLVSNPYEYVPLDRRDQDPVPRSSLPKGVRNPVKLSGGGSDVYAVPPGAFGTDQRGRLTIPVGLLHQLGIGPGQQVDVLCDSANEQVIISKSDTTSPAKADTSYTAEPDGNVRITQGTLEKANLDGLQCYRVEASDAAISVRKYS